MKPNDSDTSGGGGLMRRLAALEQSNHEIEAELGRLRQSVNTVGNRILYAVAVGALGFAFGVLAAVTG